jgi:2',3'-cyclic-nucleotide 2'-phosphodiesterase (5'-nucleotidase family)
MGRHLATLCLLALTACGATATPSPRDDETRVTLVGINDVHGHVEALPLYGGYLELLRARRAADGGAVVVLDGGDMFQGTLASNLAEGAPVVAAYEALGVDAVTVGNHEFDYGPEGPRATPGDSGMDPRGALRARAASAPYPFLSANLRATDGSVWASEIAPSVLLDIDGVAVGVIGVTTEDTLTTTLRANVADLSVDPLAGAIAREATSLRARGAVLVFVAAHAGGRCEAFDDPGDLSSCVDDEEIFEVARALPAGSVDGIVAGHTHRGVAHRVAGIPIIESFAYGRAFGRVDYTLRDGRVVDVRVHPPRDLCITGSFDGGDCDPGTYEGGTPVPLASVEEAIAPALRAAEALRQRPLGVTLVAPVTGRRSGECALGNLATDLMLAARPRADVALTNGGGLRADLPAGPLRYGPFYRAFPFDNRFAFLRATGAELARLIAENARGDGSFLSFAGLRAELRCADGRVQARLTRVDGAPIDPDEELLLVTSDFLATNPTGVLAEIADRQAQEIEAEGTIRDASAAVLEARGGTLDPAALYDPAAPRIVGREVVPCPGR